MSLMRVLGSISRTLGVVRQVAPIYRDIKPILSKAPIFFARLSGMRDNVRNVREGIGIVKNVQDYSLQQSNSNGPVFFQ